MTVLVLGFQWIFRRENGGSQEILGDALEKEVVLLTNEVDELAKEIEELTGQTTTGLA